MEIEKECITKSSIPLDVTIEILSRLPGKSVVRFRCVSKLWSSITSTPHFNKSFAVHSAARPSLLLVEKKEDKRIFCSLPHRQDPVRPYTQVEKYHMMFPEQDPRVFHSKICSSIRGLICFEDLDDQVVIWNPTLRQHVVLPDPKLPRPLVTFLGYDPIDDQYKVLCITASPRPRGDHPRVLTLGAQESWRTTELPSPPLARRYHEGVIGGMCLNGVIYYYNKSDIGNLESFDVRSEKFMQIREPDGVFGPGTGWDRVREHFITSYHGRLAWMCSGTRWVLTDPEKQKWSQDWYTFPDRSELPRIDVPYDNSFLQLGGVTDNDELIYMEAPRSRPFYAYYRDMKKKTTRWVAYEELTDCSWNCDIFPNHMENLMSLANLSFLT